MFNNNLTQDDVWALLTRYQEFVQLPEHKEVVWMGNSPSGFAKKREEFFFSMAALIGDDAELMGCFLLEKAHLVGEVWRLVPEGSELSFSISRGIEEAIKIDWALSDLRPIEASLLSLTFQLDNQAATLFGEAVLEDERTALTSFLPNAGVLAQKNLPTELADKILLKYADKIKVPLYSWRYSKEVLAKVATENLGLAPIIAMTNPFASDELFSSQLAKATMITHGLSTRREFQWMELSPKRWELFIDAYQNSFSILKKVASNPNLPNEQARRISAILCDEPLLSFSRENAEIGIEHIVKQSQRMDDFWGLADCTSYFLADFISNFSSTHLEKLYDSVDNTTLAPVLLQHSSVPASLVERILYDYPQLEAHYSKWMMVFFYYPNLWQLQAESRDYKKYYSSYLSKIYEDDLNAVLQQNDLAGCENMPASWKIEMLGLLIEAKKAKLAA